MHMWPPPERLKELNKLLEDVAKIAISTGPRGAVRFAQGIEAVVTVGGEYLLQILRVLIFFNLVNLTPSY
jgi:aarF domain-containing kinase